MTRTARNTTRTLIRLAACAIALTLAMRSYASGAACEWSAAAFHGLTALALLAAVEPLHARR